MNHTEEMLNKILGRVTQNFHLLKRSSSDEDRLFEAVIFNLTQKEITDLKKISTATQIYFIDYADAYHFENISRKTSS